MRVEWGGQVGWHGPGRGGTWEGGDLPIPTADSGCCMAESNTTV